MATYRLSGEATRDLYRIYVYGAKKYGQSLADKYYNGLFEQFQLIAENPLLFPRVDHIRPDYHRCIFMADSIYYRINGDSVDIMAIIGRQDATSHLK